LQPQSQPIQRPPQTASSPPPIGDQFRSFSQEDGISRSAQKQAISLDALATMNLVLGSSSMLLAQEKFVEERKKRGERVDPLIAPAAPIAPVTPAAPPGPTTTTNAIVEKPFVNAEPSRSVGMPGGEGAWLIVWEADKSPSYLSISLIHRCAGMLTCNQF
jgi:hypothetical protein